MNEQTIFSEALFKKDPAERQAYLHEACGQDAALRAQVEELLAAGDDAGSFLEHPPVGLDATVDASLSKKETVDNELGGALPLLEPCDKPDRIGKLGLYEIIEVVGQGGMGTVLRAFDTKLSRIVAVKVMAPELATNPTAVKRFLREAISAAAVVHDHVVTIHAVDDQSRPPYLVMEFIEGQTLQRKIDREGALPLKQILRIGSQMAAGLAAAHKTGVIHRDVKPANILLENGVQRVKITDFGLARAADDVEMTKTGVIAGTPQYMSPEQAHGQLVDSRSDLFSLGSVLYTMCTGRPAFRAETTMGTLRRVCEEAPRPIQEVNAEIPSWLTTTIDRLLAKRPEDRIQTAAEVADLLSQYLAHLQQPATMPLPATPVVPVAVPVVVPPSKDANVRAPRKSSGAGVILAICLAVLALPILAFVVLLAAWFLYSSASLKPGTPPISYHEDQTSDSTSATSPAVESQAAVNVPFLAVAPFDAKQASIHQADCAQRFAVDVEIANSLGMKLRLIPPGEFLMGETQEAADRLARSLEEGGAGEYEKFVARMSSPQHQVRLTQPFYLGAHEVTVGQYRKFIDDTKYVGTIEQLGIKGRFHWTSSVAEPSPEERAVIGVSWDDAQAFCKWLSKKEGVTYELPSEAQWEYACRAGTTTAWSFGEEAAGLAEHAVAGRPSFWPAEVVGSKAANPFGLFDMHGNADEWCLDWHQRDFYAKSPIADPVNLIDPQDPGSGRVARGGTAHSAPWWTRSTTRAYDFPATPTNPKGFRVAVVGSGDLAKIQVRKVEAKELPKNESSATDMP
jgi:eukaryotic-like serine/threonine-protein kinase